MFKPRQIIKPLIETVIIPELPDVEYFNHFIGKEEAETYFLKLCSELEFSSQTFTIMDKKIETKRKMSYHSEHSYSYNREVHHGKPWTHTLKTLQLLIMKTTGFEFNAVLCNFYENGEAGMGWHADKEKELGLNPTIASISFGETRTFAFRHRRDIISEKNPKTISEYNLNSGDLLIMKGNTQDYFEHSLLKNKAAKSPRLNLTFRKVIS
jgi:alkylated DNA repair dioxygenase AlkB